VNHKEYQVGSQHREGKGSDPEYPIPPASVLSVVSSLGGPS
jgi:hypothetical protein